MFILDVQGFQYKGSEFICKEIAIINTENGDIYNVMVKPLHGTEWFNEKIQNRLVWLTDNIHGLDWNDTGFTHISYEDISSYIINIVKDKTIFVKGHDKKIWLSKFVSNKIEELLSIGCPNLNI